MEHKVNRCGHFRKAGGGMGAMRQGDMLQRRGVEGRLSPRSGGQWPAKMIDQGARICRIISESGFRGGESVNRGFRVAEDIVSRLLEIDRRAEEVRSRARQQAEAVHQETVKRTQAAKAELEERIARGVAEADALENQARKAKLAEIEREFEEEVSRVNGISPEAVKKAVGKVVARARGASS